MQTMMNKRSELGYLSGPNVKNIAIHVLQLRVSKQGAEPPSNNNNLQYY